MVFGLRHQGGNEAFLGIEIPKGFTVSVTIDGVGKISN